MARMIPDVAPASIKNDGERSAYRALAKQLPANWIIRHHFPFCWKERGMLRDGEADFIVIAPNRGLMVVEVKGSHGFESKDGLWYRIKPDGTRELADNPFEQATKTAHRLTERIAIKAFNGRNKQDFPGTFGHLVMYPHGRIEGPLPSSTEPVLMIAFKDMDNLRERFNSAFDQWNGTRPVQGFDGKSMSTLVAFLTDETRGIPVLAASIEEDDLRIEELTKLQFSTFKGLLASKRVHVTGPAGSGKTLLAIWTAQNFVENERRVLFVCYNKVLAEWLRRSRGSKFQFDIHSFHSLCRQVVMKAKLPFVPDQTGFWETMAPSLFLEAIDHLPPVELDRYDAVIVDEAQDFHADWWLPLQLLLRNPDDDRLCLFSDADQRKLYGRGSSFPTGLIPFELQENCRNSKRIAEYSRKMIDRPRLSTFLQPEGCPPRILPSCEEAAERGRTVQKVCGEMLREGFRPSQIAILSPYASHHSCSTLKTLVSVDKFPVSGRRESVVEWMQGRLIWASTIKAFKGLEADCIIVTDIMDEDLHDSGLCELYVGATRAKHQLIFLPASTETKNRLLKFI
jgi:Nuclease-related domain/UvrD-like helicase C-terminal domain/AAA domain